MREILFRGKRVDNGAWVEGLPFSSIYGGFSNGAICAIRQTVEKYGDIHDVVIETVGQYTGLTDKNGKRIFEGDIIMPTVLSNCPPCEVMFDVAEGQFVVRDACGDYHGALANFGRIFDNRYTVIGNKWDDPELLEVEE